MATFIEILMGFIGILAIGLLLYVIYEGYTEAKEKDCKKSASVPVKAPRIKRVFKDFEVGTATIRYKLDNGKFVDEAVYGYVDQYVSTNSISKLSVVSGLENAINYIKNRDKNYVKVAVEDDSNPRKFYFGKAVEAEIIATEKLVVNFEEAYWENN